jgi:hypothetical protein
MIASHSRGDGFQAYLESSDIPRLQVYLTTRRSSNKRAVDGEVELKWRAGVGVSVCGRRRRTVGISTDGGGGVLVWVNGVVMGWVITAIDSDGM